MKLSIVLGLTLMSLPLGVLSHPDPNTCPKAGQECVPNSQENKCTEPSAKCADYECKTDLGSRKGGICTKKPVNCTNACSPIMQGGSIGYRPASYVFTLYTVPSDGSACRQQCCEDSRCAAWALRGCEREDGYCCQIYRPVENTDTCCINPGGSLQFIFGVEGNEEAQVGSGPCYKSA